MPPILTGRRSLKMFLSGTERQSLSAHHWGEAAKVNMRIFTLVVVGGVALSLACQKPEVVPPAGSPLKASASPAVSPSPNPGIPKDGKYDAKGVVTKINMQLGSVEIDHEDIPNMMPPMKMEFYVQDKKMLDGLAVGDKVDFVLEYKHPTETIAAIKKAK